MDQEQHRKGTCEVLILKIPVRLFAVFLPMQQPRSACQLHPCAYLAWQAQRPACKMMWTNRGKHIGLAWHLEEQHPVDRKEDNTGSFVHKQWEKPWCQHLWTADWKSIVHHIYFFFQSSARSVEHFTHNKRQRSLLMVLGGKFWQALNGSNKFSKSTERESGSERVQCHTHGTRATTRTCFKIISVL